MCAAPFAGPGSVVMRLMGRGRWPKNPKYCAGCFAMLRANHGGAEVECSLLFADIRGSTPLAEQMAPREFTRLMGRFYDASSEVLVNHDAFVDKFVGDEIIGIFVPAMAGDGHARRAIDAAQALLRRTGHGDAGGPWVPVGVGVNTGNAYVGSVGLGSDTELTAMGDAVNITARLSSAAGAGEVLVTVAAAASAELAPEGLERRSLHLKGKSEATEVVVLGPS
jgi:adenylate cyclase